MHRSKQRKAVCPVGPAGVRKGSKMPKLYYAHAMCLYGEADEREELRRIRKRFRRVHVVNPAKYDGHPDKQTDTVGFCLKLIDGCDVVVFSRLLGKISAGVGKEVNHALKTGKLVFELSPNKIIPRNRRVKYLSRAATISLYRKYRASLWEAF